MIRPALTDDIPAILSIWNAVIRDTVVTFNPVEKSEADLRKLLADKQAAGQAFLVAEFEGSVAGFATYGPFRNGLGYAKTVEHSIMLAPRAHGKGLGRALMAAIEQHAQGSGVHSIFAGVSSGNPDGIAFHTAMGFQTAAVLPQVGYKFGTYWDLVLMQKFLS